MNDNMPKHSLRTTFNSTEPTRMPQKAPWIPPVRKDTTLQNLKKTFDTVGDYKDSYENMGIPGLLGHYLENTGRIGKGNFKMDFPNMTLYAVRIYNRVLSAKEIKQNFEAQRSRFGV